MALDTQTLDQAALDALVGKAFAEISAGYGGVLIDIGNKLGLYKAMAGAGPLTSQDVARAAGCAERYVREWLNSQAAGGYVQYHAESRTYELTRAGLRARRRTQPGLHAARLAGGGLALGRGRRSKPSAPARA